MKNIRKWMQINGIRKNLLFYSIVTTLVMFLASLFIFLSNQSMILELKKIYEEYIYLNNLNNNVTELETQVESYLLTKSSDSLLRYYNIFNTLQSYANTFKKSHIVNEKDLMLKDIGYMLENLLIETESAINAKRGRNIELYVQNFTDSQKLSRYIKKYISEILYNMINDGSKTYLQTTQYVSFMARMTIIFVFGFLFLSWLLSFWLSGHITKPLNELALRADYISKGRFDFPPLKYYGKDEVGILTQTFQLMVDELRHLISEKEKQLVIKKKLIEQEAQLFKMQAIVRESELKALQSQVKPHFLFNTLNTASHMAMLEGADETSAFLGQVAIFYRYHLKNIDQPVSVKDEWEHIQSYVYILKTRFGHRITFDLKADPSIFNIVIPSTIILPLVENALIHGLENKEQLGKIKIWIKRVDNHVEIGVSDNGKGMETDKIDALINSESILSRIESKHNGFGLVNLIQRLKLFYKEERNDRFIKIDSMPNHGTIVRLFIPIITAQKE